jgi:pyruvate formate lyase activating enzyme
VESCWQNALEICGKSCSPEELLPLLLKDRMFFQNGGGVTFSGGEPLLYPEFIREIFSLLHEKNIHTALDTCGEVPFESFLKVIPFTNLFLFDLKGMDAEQHSQNTGKSNSRIHENLRRLADYGIPVEIRMPVIPGLNDAETEFHAAGKLLQEIKTVQSVKLLAYHSMAREKYHAAGLRDTMPDVPPPGAELLKKRAEILQKYLPVPVCF